MAPVFLYKCRVCGTEVEAPRPLAVDSRHLVDGEVCGALKRVWQVNFGRVPGGGREK